PHIARKKLYKLSGHLPYYKDDMYPPMKDEGGDYYLKPMNCPFTHMVYSARKHSYRELPIRYAEFGTVYRKEASGELLGLLRVRGMTQNDAHIYCLENQVVEELVKVMDLHNYYYKLFGIRNYYVELALPDEKKKKDKYFDDPEGWKQSIKLLREASKNSKMDVVEKEGSAAFYGPKFDFNVKSVTGREFGASTNQLDFGSGKRFKLTYTDRDGGEKIVPYIIHRAPLGSDERFIGFLIEHFKGAFLVWLSPVQVKVLPVSEKNIKYGTEVMKKLRNEEIRVELDERSETLQAKIRDAQIAKIPYMIIVGDKEEKASKVAVRLRTEKDLGQMSFDKLVRVLKDKIESRSLDLI
ncbi:MAG: threonine--tRNA ligase, partial [Patescibacteria group bacterium]